MRLLLPVLALSLLLTGAPAARAAPTCLDRQGDTVRCGTPGAMPVGWRPPPVEMAGRAAMQGGGPGLGRLVGLAAFLAGLFALILLLPDFQGRWDGQGSDDEAGRD